MDAGQWKRVAELFDLAAEQPPLQRDAFLANACAGAEELRREVESLLGHGGSEAGPLERIAEQVENPWACPPSIGKYRILSRIGEGGMGAVYEAEQDHPRRIVALKVIKSALAGSELVHRFVQEIEALGRLQHPGIARIYEAGVAGTALGPQPYFAMEFIRGLPLLEHARLRNLNVPQRLALMIKICEAADHAHQRGIVHRDLKPGNILVDESGQPKILDFGLARISDRDANTTRQTSPGDLLGTLAYMSPEQVAGNPSQLDARSDVYSLGVVLYELLAGQLPYVISSHVAEAARAVREQDPAPLSTVSRVYRGDVETIVTKALEKDKARRYASAEELASDLRRYLADQPILARSPGVLYQAGKFARRHRVLMSAAVAVFLILLAGVIASTGEAIRANRERDYALRAEQTASAVNDFLQNDLLAQAGARAQAGRHGAPDPDLKVRTALDRAAERIAGKFDSQPLVEAAIRRTIGLAYFDLSLLGKAQDELERAAELRQRALGPEHPDTLASMDELGVLYTYEARYPLAEEVLTKVLQGRKRVLGATHKDTLKTMSNLGTAISYEGDDARVAPLFANLLEIKRHIYGEAHPETLSAIDDLASVYNRTGRFAEAEALFQQEVHLSSSVLGPGHPDTINCIHNLATVYRAEGKYAQADRLFTEALDARRRAFGEEHWETQNSRYSLALSYRAQGRFPEAEKLMVQAAEGLRRAIGEQHPLTIRVRYNLAEVYRRQRRFADAESLFHEVLNADRRSLGEDNLYTAQVLESLGEMKLSQRSYTEAEGLLREAARVRREKYPQSWQRYYAETLLGATLAGLGRYPEAEALLSSGYQGMLRLQNSIPAENREDLERARIWREQLSRGTPAAARQLAQKPGLGELPIPPNAWR